MKRLLLFLFWSLNLCADEHKIVYMLTTPRSLGTAMFRMFENHEDFTGFIEPNSVIYKRATFNKEKTDTWFKEITFETEKDILDSVYAAKETSHVVLKDTAYCAENFLATEEDFIRDKDVHFVFLVRDPYEVQCSMYKKHKKTHEILRWYVGTKFLYETYKKIQTISPNKVHLIITKNLVEQPKKAIEPIFSAMNIPFSENSLLWDDLGEDFDGRAWRTSYKKDEFRKWHKNAIHSTHISKPTSKKRPLESDIFSHALTTEDYDLLHNINAFHTPYYELFLREDALQRENTL